MQTSTTSRLRFSTLLICCAAFVSSPSNILAQGGTGTITVRPNFNTSILDGFTVCAGTSTNRALYGTRTTGSTGVATFTGIPVGTQVVTTVKKTNFIGREVQWTAPVAGANTSVTVSMSTGFGGPECPPAATSTAPTTSSVQITVNPGVNVARNGFHVCVGTAQNRGQYGYALTPTSGTVSFSNLPGNSMIVATAVKSGYTGAGRDWYPSPGQTSALTMNVSAGSGGYTCPGYLAPSVTVSGEIRIATDPPRLGLELLAIRGDDVAGPPNQRHTCSQFGGNYVLVGLKVRHRVTKLVGLDLYCAPLRADGKLGSAVFLPATAPPEGTPQEAKCPAGQAVVGYQGTVDGGLPHWRSVVLHCAALSSTGLSTGTVTKTTALGINSGRTFGPDACNGGRPAREVRLIVVPAFLSPPSIGAWRLGCEQPIRPTS